MPRMDIDRYIEQSGVRKARFGGYEPEDVRRVLLELGGEYEQELIEAEKAAEDAAKENDALRRRCQTLLAQNQTLSTQAATLAGRTDKLAHTQDGLESRLTQMQEKNRSLSDQNAVLRLKNGDLIRLNDELRRQAQQSDDALRVKGRELEQARADVEAGRAAVLADAQKEADHLLADAQARADKLLDDMQLRADAIDQTARDQAVEQARKLVRAATDETREIQNAHRLRLEDLKRQTAAMEQYRAELLDYLAQVSHELERVRDFVRADAPDAPQEDPSAPPAPEPVLDLSDQTLNDAADALRAARAETAAQPLDGGPAAHNRVVEPAAPPAPQPAAPQDTFEVRPAARSAARAAEVPGSIFSAPIVHRRPAPILDEVPPPRLPRAPLMPTLPDDDDEDAQEAPLAAPPAPAAAPKPDNARRKKAVAAVRALQRQRGEKTEERP